MVGGLGLRHGTLPWSGSLIHDQFCRMRQLQLSLRVTFNQDVVMSLSLTTGQVTVLVLSVIGIVVLSYGLGVLVTQQRYRKKVSERDNMLFRYRTAIHEWRVWCNHVHPVVGLIADHLEAAGNGQVMNAGTPNGTEACTISGHRTQLCKLLGVKER